MSDINEPDLFDGESLELVVPATLEGMRVDRVISMLTGRSRAEAVEAIEHGRVRVNDKVVTKASLQLDERPAPRGAVARGDGRSAAGRCECRG